MPRILRNYLISFLIIGLFLLAVHLIDKWAEERQAKPTTPPLLPSPAASQAR